MSFAYPSRPKVQVCKDYSLTIAPGETVALVGPSGSGKSTIVSVLERFYDPLSGSVKLDGVDVKELNVKWLREQVGLVGAVRRMCGAVEIRAATPVACSTADNYT